MRSTKSDERQGAEPKARKRRRAPLWVVAPNLLYVVLLIVITASNAMGPERWWAGSANLYLPQWVWALPAVPLLVLTLAAGRRVAWIPIVCGLYVAGPLMGYCWNPNRPEDGNGVHLKVMTYNIKWYKRGKEIIIDQVQRYKPDLLQIQDGSNALHGPLRTLLEDWNVRADGQYLIASRYPLGPIQSVDISYPGSRHHAVQTTLTVDGTPITVIDVHLLSPREGLVAVRHEQVDTMADNASARLYEAGKLAAHLKTLSGPVIVTGDLNSPMQSLACRALFDVGMKDAFALAGDGYGYTYGQFTKVRMPFVRIDHILFNDPWVALDCTVGDPRGSDHIPVIADLLLPAGSKHP